MTYSAACSSARQTRESRSPARMTRRSGGYTRRSPESQRRTVERVLTVPIDDFVNGQQRPHLAVLGDRRGEAFIGAFSVGLILADRPAAAGGSGAIGTPLLAFGRADA